MELAEVSELSSIERYECVRCVLYILVLLYVQFPSIYVQSEGQSKDAALLSHKQLACNLVRWR